MTILFSSKSGYKARRSRSLPAISSRGGFMALTALVLISSGSIVFSYVTLSAAFTYFQSINKRELRIQAGLNAVGCLEYTILMVAGDYFVSGNFPVSEFGCTTDISNDGMGNIQVNIQSKMGEAIVRGRARIEYDGQRVRVIDKGTF